MAAHKKIIQTLSDIARESGVSRQVVSAILNPENTSNIRYSQKTYEKVMQVVKNSCYRPNRTAASLVSQRHGSIGVIIKNTGNIPGYCIQFMLDYAGKRDQIISLESLNKDENKLPLFIREDCVDGLIVFEDLPQSHVEEIRRLRIPCLYVNNNMVEDAESITFDEEDAMIQAVEHFLKKGKQNLAIFLPDSSHYSVEARKKGLEKTLAEKKMTSPLIYRMGNQFYNFNMDHQVREQERLNIEAFLLENPQIDGILLYSERMVSLCYDALRALGKEIPRDIAVMGISFSSAGLGSSPMLSILRINPKELGHRLIEEINRQIDGTKRPSSALVMKYELLEKEST